MGEHTYAARLARAERHDEIAAQCRERAAYLLSLAGEGHHLSALHPRRGDYLADSESRRRGFKDHHEERSKLFSRATWHERKGRGERNRVEKVERCKTEEYTRACNGCGAVAEDDEQGAHFTRCEAWRYCVSCRGARCAAVRERFDVAAERWRHVFRSELNSPWRRWSEKMVTYTVPHSGSSSKDLAILYECFRRYFPAIRKWMRKSDSRARCVNKPGELGYVSAPVLPYLRVFELTGSDEGHAHLHSWMVGPYLPHYVARIEWGKSIGYSGGRRGKSHLKASYLPVRHIDDVLADIMPIGPNCGHSCEHLSCKRNRWVSRTASKQIHELATVQHGRRIQWLPWPVVDIREASTTVGSELVKYLTKDIGPDKEHVEAFAYAQLIEATEGRRLVCVSSHFWVELPPRCCATCELTFKRIRLASSVPFGGGARAPPLQFIQEA